MIGRRNHAVSDRGAYQASPDGSPGAVPDAGGVARRPTGPRFQHSRKRWAASLGVRSRAKRLLRFIVLQSGDWTVEQDVEKPHRGCGRAESRLASSSQTPEPLSHAGLSLLARHNSAAPSPNAWFPNVLLVLRIASIFGTSIFCNWYLDSNLRPREQIVNPKIGAFRCTRSWRSSRRACLPHADEHHGLSGRDGADRRRDERENCGGSKAPETVDVLGWQGIRMPRKKRRSPIRERGPLIANQLRRSPSHARDPSSNAASAGTLAPPQTPADVRGLGGSDQNRWCGVSPNGRKTAAQR